jgi:hypothetical protein
VKTLRLEIGEVRLRGFGALDGERVRAAAVRELERLLADDAVASHARDRRHVDAGRMELGRGASAEDVGAAIGHAVKRGLS